MSGDKKENQNLKEEKMISMVKIWIQAMMCSPDEGKIRDSLMLMPARGKELGMTAWSPPETRWALPAEVPLQAVGKRGCGQWAGMKDTWLLIISGPLLMWKDLDCELQNVRALVLYSMGSRSREELCDLEQP